MRLIDLTRVLSGMTSARNGSSFDLGKTCAIRFDNAACVEIVSFFRSFPSGFTIEGLQIGAPLASALAIYPTLSLTDTQHLKNGADIEHYHGGKTLDGHEVVVRAEAGQIIALDLARAGYRAGELCMQAAKDAVALERKDQIERAARWKSIPDPEMMLDDWASHGFTGGNWGQTYRAYAAWLRRASPRDRHRAACAWNWDHGTAPLKWMIRQPNTDLATAAQIFFDAEPSFYADVAGDRSKVPHHALDAFDLLREIVDRAQRDFYPVGHISLNGRALFKRLVGEASATEYRIFDRDLDGESVTLGGFADGFPEEMYPLTNP